MPISSSLISWLMFKRLNQIDLTRKYPIQTQNEVFQRLIVSGRQTSWGKKHNYDNIHTIEDYQKQVPLQTYESLRPYIDQLRAGEKNVLWPGEIKWFAKSSGTTADKSKFIPVSPESMENCHFRGGKDAMAIYSQLNPNSRILKGKGLIIGGSHQINNLSNDSYYGDLSAVLLQNMPFWTSLIRTPDISIALMDEWEAKIERMAEATLKENVTSISGVPSWTLVLIKKLFDISGKDNLRDVWPDLELFIHGGVSFTPYREEYKKAIRGQNMHYLETYNASEGFFGIQDDFSTKDMLLMLDLGVFFEFIPMDEFEKDNPQAVPIEGVKTNTNYAIVITTNSGLWRYIIGDTVKFTSTNPYKFKITGRTKHFINAFGEEIIVDNATEALNEACSRTGASIKEYTAAPVYMETGKKGKHQWLIEFSTMPDNLEHFGEIMDIHLKSVNSDYEAKRYKNMSLDTPEIIVARENLFYDWLKAKGKLGGQHKIPRLANNRNYIDGMLKMNEV